jgi:DNA-binding LytR/AlgR family response regulator
MALHYWSNWAKSRSASFCITAYNEFALKAFRFSALDYLLKPLDTARTAGGGTKSRKTQRIDQRQLDMLRLQLHGGQHPQKIAVPHQSGVRVCRAERPGVLRSGQQLHESFLTSGKNYLLSRTLRDVQEVLEERNFLRVHRQYLVNLDHIKMYHKGEAAYLVMHGDINYSRSQKSKRQTGAKVWLAIGFEKPVCTIIFLYLNCPTLQLIFTLLIQTGCSQKQSLFTGMFPACLRIDGSLIYNFSLQELASVNQY